ncbi:MAG: (Fe-S)-binding protein [Thermomicrobiales bacterium]
MHTIRSTASAITEKLPTPRLGGRGDTPGLIPGATPALIANTADGMTVALYPGCMTTMFYPEQAEAIGTVLQALGVAVIAPENLHCCGLIPHNSGDAKHARPMIERTIKRLEAIPADYIISGSASCVAMIAQDYLHVLRNDPLWHARAERLANRIIDFTSFLINVAQIPAGSLTPLDGGTYALTYHDSCQGLNALGLKAEPRYLLQDVMGYKLRELGEVLCCGFGGSFSLEYPLIAERLMNRKLDNADTTGAPVLVTDNQGCLMHLRGGADASGRSLQVKHIAELLADRVRERQD